MNGLAGYFGREELPEAYYNWNSWPDPLASQIVFASKGNAWLESSNKLTPHDPLAAVCIFHPDVCQVEKGFVQVETHEETLALDRLGTIKRIYPL